MNKAYVFQPAGEKHSPKNVLEKDRHCHQYLQFQTWETEAGRTQVEGPFGIHSQTLSQKP